MQLRGKTRMYTWVTAHPNGKAVRMPCQYKCAAAVAAMEHTHPVASLQQGSHSCCSHCGCTHTEYSGHTFRQQYRVLQPSTADKARHVTGTRHASSQHSTVVEQRTENQTPTMLRQHTQPSKSGTSKTEAMATYNAQAGRTGIRSPPQKTTKQASGRCGCVRVHIASRHQWCLHACTCGCCCHLRRTAAALQC